MTTEKNPRRVPPTGAELAEKYGFEEVPHWKKDPFVRPMTVPLSEDLRLASEQARIEKLAERINRGAVDGDLLRECLSTILDHEEAIAILQGSGPARERDEARAELAIVRRDLEETKALLEEASVLLRESCRSTLIRKTEAFLDAYQTRLRAGE